jgi:predicted nucleic acid-binding protein
MEYKMKKYTFKGILLAMGLVFATLSVQAQETRPGMIYCCENVDLDSVSARYINDSTFEIHVKADENLHFLDVNVLSGTYNKLIKNNGQYIQTRVVLSGDHTGTDQFKIYAEKLDFGSRIRFSWDDLVTMGNNIFKNYDYGNQRYERIEFKRTVDIYNWWRKIDAVIDVTESGPRWDKQKLVVEAAKSEVLTALSVVTNIIDTSASIKDKWIKFEAFEAKFQIHKKEVKRLAHPHTTIAITTAHQAVINRATADNQRYALKLQPFKKKLEAVWTNQYQKTNEAYESAKAVKEQREQDKSPTATLQVVVAEYLKEKSTTCCIPSSLSVSMIAKILFLTFESAAMAISNASLSAL